MSIQDYNPTVDRHCEIDGLLKPYDICGTGDLDKMKNEYGARYRYIGSSQIIYINRKLDPVKEIHHFFVRK